ncbi:type II secretion system F family protein [Aquibacillus albus]|uniref:Type IV pilus assembly protein PilC n=1 Tax=Aquibacillus albus TaxID=1168171 RepID=A0ABS2N1K4_9BACI|nr:type II secretion system F family protein [Aquibacillus albus]MBM7572019.1 type IV pilus assembly protein PilC [Aquibacillus albus]
MAYFRYKGRNNSGKRKVGKLKAETERDAISQLKRDGIVVFDIRELNSVLYKEINLGIQLGNKVKKRDFIIFLRQFATLVDAGISLVESATILEDQTENKHLKHALTGVIDQLEAGQSLSESMKKYPSIFPELLVNMVHAGEVSGNLDEILENMADYYEKQYEQRQKVITALTYPMVVGIVSLFITIYLLAFVVPTFVNMFVSIGEEIPLYTAFVLRISSFLQYFWWMIPLLFVGFVVLNKYLATKPNYAYRLDSIKMKIPLFGNMVKKAALARMTRTLSSLLHSSVPIVEAVKITENVVDSSVIKHVLQKSQLSLEEGESMAIPMKKHWVFPAMVTEMIAVGEQTGELDEMLHKVANFYEMELDNAAEKLKTLIEPLLIIFIAVVVGSIVLAIILPLFAVFDTF